MKGDPRFDGERRWAVGQLKDAQAPEKEGELVIRMLEEWWSDGLGPGDDPWRALGWFEQLARGKALLTPTQADIKFAWIPVKHGQITRGEYVRVLSDAYDGVVGRSHNGRSGPVVAIRNGDIHVMYDDGRERLDMAARHAPYSLEKRIELP